MGIFCLYNMTSLLNRFLDHPSITIDTRTIVPGQIYFAIKGEHFDGNQFVMQALEKGASICVSSDKTFLGVENVVVVDDTLKALQKLSEKQQLAYRDNPRLNSIALAENIIVAERRIQNAFKANGIVSQVTPADIYALHNIGNPGMSVAARKGQMARTAVSASALNLNKGLYIKGNQTTAKEYMNQVTKKLNQGMYDIQNGKSRK